VQHQLDDERKLHAREKRISEQRKALAANLALLSVEQHVRRCGSQCSGRAAVQRKPAWALCTWYLSAAWNGAVSGAGQ
jgi:hypothetical protein